MTTTIHGQGRSPTLGYLAMGLSATRSVVLFPFRILYLSVMFLSALASLLLSAVLLGLMAFGLAWATHSISSATEARIGSVLRPLVQKMQSALLDPSGPETAESPAP